MSPERIKLHGATAGSATGPVPIVPLFAFSKTTLHADILITPLEQYSTSYSVWISLSYALQFLIKIFTKLMVFFLIG